MDLTYSPDDLQFREKTRRWFQANVPQGELKTLDERKQWHRKMYDAGYVGMHWPKEHGGQGWGPMRMAIASDEMARANAPAAINGLGIGFIGPTIIIHGTDWQKQRYLKTILTAEEIWCQLYSEPNSGSDLASLRTRAEDQGDHFLVNGQKIWTSSGHIADFGILLARTDPSVPKHKGISCFLFNMRQPGVDVRPLKQITGGAEFNEVFMTNAKVEKAESDRPAGSGLGDRADDARLRARRQLARARHALQGRLRPAGAGHQEAQAARPPALRGPRGADEDGADVRRAGSAALRRAARAVRAREGRGARRGLVDHQAVLQRVREALLRAVPGDPRPVWTDHGRAAVSRSSRWTSIRRRECAAPGPTPSCGRGRGRSIPGRRRSRRTSSASGCSGCPRKCGSTA